MDQLTGHRSMRPRLRTSVYLCTCQQQATDDSDPVLVIRDRGSRPESSGAPVCSPRRNPQAPQWLSWQLHTAHTMPFTRAVAPDLVPPGLPGLL